MPPRDRTTITPGRSSPRAHLLMMPRVTLIAARPGKCCGRAACIPLGARSNTWRAKASAALARCGASAPVPGSGADGQATRASAPLGSGAPAGAQPQSTAQSQAATAFIGTQLCRCRQQSSLQTLALAAALASANSGSPHRCRPERAHLTDPPPAKAERGSGNDPNDRFERKPAATRLSPPRNAQPELGIAASPSPGWPSLTNLVAPIALTIAGSQPFRQHALNFVHFN